MTDEILKRKSKWNTNGITLSGQDDLLIEKIKQCFDAHDKKLRAILKGMWWEINRTQSDSLWLTRMYAGCGCGSGKIGDFSTIEKWIQDIQCENPYYIFIEFYGNGIMFKIIEDIYGIMEE